MNPEDKKRWVDALRSGKYQQGFGQLRTRDNKFCCLGVACDVFQPEEWRKGTILYDSRLAWYNGYDLVTLPKPLQKRLGLDVNGTLPDRRMLVSLNDVHRLSFKEIADIIEKLL